MKPEIKALLNDLDRTLAIVGATLSVILIIYLTFEIGRIVYILTGFLVLISCILWIALCKTHSFKTGLTESRTETLVCIIIFFTLLTLSILSMRFRTETFERPLSFFILASLMAGVIVYEVFSSNKSYSGIILLQIVVFGLTISLSEYTLFPQPLGVDPWYHSALTNCIIEEGIIPGGYSYTNLPLFHLSVASSSLVLGVSYKAAVFISVSLGLIVCNTLFIFLITRRMIKNHQVSLLAALLVIIANNHIYMTFWPIPNALAVLFIPMIFYLAALRSGIRNVRVDDLKICAIILVLLVAILLTHSIGAASIAILLFVAWASFVFYRIVFLKLPVSRITLLAPFGFIAAMLAWWANSGHLKTLEVLIKKGFSADYFNNIPAKGVNIIYDVPVGEEIFKYIGMFLFFSLSFIGFFYMISRRGNHLSFVVAFVGIVPLAVGFFPTFMNAAIALSRCSCS